MRVRAPDSGRARSTLVPTGVVVSGGAVYLLVYMWAIQHLVITRTDLSRFADIPSVQAAPEWTSKLLAKRARSPTSRSSPSIR